MIKRGVFFLSLFSTLFNILPQQLCAQYRIQAEIQGYEGDTIMLGYFYGEKQYLRDTSIRNDEGHFIFEADTFPDPGVYMLVLPPDNQFMQLLLHEGNYNFTINTHYDSLIESATIKGSKDNELFYDYLSFLNYARAKAEKLKNQSQGDDSKDNNSTNTKALTALDEEVKSYQQNILKNHPETLTALLIRSGQEVSVPEFEGLPEEEKRMKQYQYYKKHFFDHYDFTDERLLRSPILFKRIENYVDKLTPQIPDSINHSIDVILGQMNPGSEMFKYYLIHFLNKYAKSKVVGQDAVYVHLVDKYYAEGKAPWTKEDQLEKIIENAETLKPILIGKIAPDVILQNRQKERISLHDVKADYTVLFFWAPDCGHCEKKMPEMIEFYKEYHPKGVEIVAICTKVTDKVPECWEAIDERGMDIWMNLVDPYLLSKYKQKYDIKSTPTIYVLDHNKKILSKRIGVDQLPEVMDHILSQMGSNETNK